MDELSDLRRCLRAVLRDDPHDRGSYDGSVRDVRAFGRLLGLRDAEADGAGDIRVRAHLPHDRRKVRLYLSSRAGHAQARHDIEETLRLLRDHRDTAGRCRRDQRDQLYAVFAAGRQKLLALLKRNVRKDQTVYSDLTAGFQETFRAVGKYHIGVRHEHHRDRHVLAQFTHKIKDLIGSYAALKRAHVGLLDHRALRRRIGEGNAELHQIRAVSDSLAHGLRRGRKIRIPAGDERNECLAVIKRFRDPVAAVFLRLAGCIFRCIDRNAFACITHGCPPLCIWRSPHSPYRRGRRSSQQCTCRCPSSERASWHTPRRAQTRLPG